MSRLARNPINIPEDIGTQMMESGQILSFIPIPDLVIDSVISDMPASYAGLQRGDIISRVNNAGKNYLDTGSTLLHGDYYPGSWMERNDNIYIIDPEFTFLGSKEFDLGVMSAHLIIKTGDLNIINQIKRYYPSNIQINLMRQFAGIEIIRRIIGVAKLPINRSINEKIHLIKIAKSLVV